MGYALHLRVTVYGETESWLLDLLAVGIALGGQSLATLSYGSNI